jgi:uncharacterized alkaline shock family protein YloU
MTYKINTPNGLITIENDVIAKIAGLAATDCYGIVGMASRNVKDGFVQLLRRENLARGIVLHVTGNQANVDLHIIVEYGTNIPAIAETLASTVQYRIEEYVGLKLNKINIFVEGIRIH